MAAERLQFNIPCGLEHGVTVSSKPQGKAMLQLYCAHKNNKRLKAMTVMPAMSPAMEKWCSPNS